MAGIRFGTDGWRAVIADDFTFAHVRVVAQGIANYLREVQLHRRPVLVGYDTRFLAERFAQEAAGVLAGNGLAVVLSATDLPTPALAFAVLDRMAAGAVMLTASHNPPEYMGMKFIPHYGGPAMSDVTGAIEAHIRTVQEEEGSGQLAVRAIPLDQARRQGLLETADFRPAYLDHVVAVVRGRSAPGRPADVIYDAMHGTGREYAPDGLSALGLRVTRLRGHRDPLFGGGAPEPTAAHLQALVEAVRSRPGVLGLATDGDADRFGVVDEGGRYLTPNEVLAVVADHLMGERAMRGAVVRSVATTHMLDRLAAEYGVALRETPVGFKYIGAAMRSEPVVLGGEESGGLSIAGHIPEKDGILAIMLAALIWRESGGRPLARALESIWARHGTLVTERLDLPVPETVKQRAVEQLSTSPPDRWAGQGVERVVTLDGAKLILRDGSWCLVRPSGTEPLLRVYLEAPSRAGLEGMTVEIRAFLESLR